MFVAWIERKWISQSTQLSLLKTATISNDTISEESIVSSRCRYFRWVKGVEEVYGLAIEEYDAGIDAVVNEPRDFELSYVPIGRFGFADRQKIADGVERELVDGIVDGKKNIHVVYVQASDGESLALIDRISLGS
jgi:hypothetical protein